MLKKITVLIFVAFFSISAVYAQDNEKTGMELEFSGEMKTGIYWEKILHDQVMLRPPNQESPFADEKVIWHNNDDAGANEGRFRLNLHLINHDLNMGMKVRFQQTVWTATEPNRWDYAFAYGDFFNNQLRVTMGKLYESPWAAGGPDIWQELEGGLIGIRFEYRPNWLGGLNFGFVLNQSDLSIYYYDKRTVIETLKESVVGIAYTNDFFHGRFSWRFDGEADVYNDMQEGMSMMYRLEERILKNYLPGLQLWAAGWYKGIGGDERIKEEFMVYTNFLYAQYDHDDFTTQLRLRYDLTGSVQRIGARLSFTYNIFDWLSAGIAGRYLTEVGQYRSILNVPFNLTEVEPQIRINLNKNAYLAFVYCYRWEYVRNMDQTRFPDKENLLKETQWFNLRSVFSF
jgi:hypothetical protein